MGKLVLRDIIEIYKANDFKISELRLILEDTSKEYQDIKELEKEQIENKKLLAEKLDSGHKILSENWTFTKGRETIRKTPDTARVKKLQDLLDKNNLFYIDDFGNQCFFSKPLFKETKIAPRLTITPPKKEKN